MQQMPKNIYNDINTGATILIIHSKPLSDHEIKVSCMTRISAFIDPGFLLHQFIFIIDFNRFMKYYHVYSLEC